MTNILFFVITNIITLIVLPRDLCYDMAVMGAYFDTHDTNPVYGLKIDVLDINSNIIANGWVRESYVPPMTEMVSAIITPNAMSVRCEIFGTNLNGKWKDAYFSLMVIQPKLNISLVKSNIVINWIDYGHCWKLECTTNGINWKPSESIIPVTDKTGLFMFRLVRFRNPLTILLKTKG
jgi:hypothetical protein